MDYKQKRTRYTQEYPTIRYMKAFEMGNELLMKRIVGVQLQFKVMVLTHITREGIREKFTKLDRSTTTLHQSEGEENEERRGEGLTWLGEFLLLGAS